MTLIHHAANLINLDRTEKRGTSRTHQHDEAGRIALTGRQITEE